MFRRLVLAAAVMAAAGFAGAQATNDATWAALAGPAVVLFRHAEAPGVGDPAGFRLGDCRTQRNLSAQGRDQARALGERWRASGLQVGQVLTSQWCRTRETAELAFPGMVREAPHFNSFFGDTAKSVRQSAAARAQLAAWRGPGVLVVVTHQVNITALTGVYPASGEGAVLRRAQDGTLELVGRLSP
jgi:phosphohistidine phosphatase SixA